MVTLKINGDFEDEWRMKRMKMTEKKEEERERLLG
jgi:hypothetical protein